jgi:hypothetical protein
MTINKEVSRRHRDPPKSRSARSRSGGQEVLKRPLHRRRRRRRNLPPPRRRRRRRSLLHRPRRSIPRSSRTPIHPSPQIIPTPLPLHPLHTTPRTRSRTHAPRPRRAIRPTIRRGIIGGVPKQIRCADPTRWSKTVSRYTSVGGEGRLAAWGRDVAPRRIDGMCARQMGARRWQRWRGFV